MNEKEEATYKRLHIEAFEFLKKHWNDTSFGEKDEEIQSNNPLDFYKEGSIMYDYVLLQMKRPKSGLWQELLLLELEHLERKMKHDIKEREKQNEA